MPLREKKKRSLKTGCKQYLSTGGLNHLDVDLCILLDVRQEPYFPLYLWVQKAVMTMCLLSMRRGLLDSRSNLLNMGKTLQKEGLVKAWLTATLAKQKKTMGMYSAEIEVKKPSYITIVCSHRGLLVLG